MRLISLSKHLFAHWLTLALVMGTGGGPAAADEPNQGFQVSAIALRNARIVTEPGAVIESGTVLIRDGRIIAVGADIAIPPDAEMLDLDGLTMLPGFIDAATSSLIKPDVKLPEVERRSVDVSRQALASVADDDHGGLTPQFTVDSALRSETGELDKFRRAGFCLVHVVPSGRILSGQSALVQLTGQPPRESVLLAGPMQTLKVWERHGDEYPSTMMGICAHLRQKFLDADRAAVQQRLFQAKTPGIDRPALDPVWEALTKLHAGPQRALWEVASRDDIERALRFSAEQSLKPVLWGPRELPWSLEPLRQHQVDVLVTLNFGDEPKPTSNDASAEFPKVPEPETVLKWKQARWKERIGLAAALHAAGVRFSISTEGLKSPEELFASLRQMIGQGLSADVALAGMTRHPAEMLGVDAEYGRIAPGYRANLTILTGPIDHDQTKVRYIFVGGQRFEYHRDAKPVKPQTAAPSNAVDVQGTWELTIDSGDTPFPATLEVQPGANALGGRFSSGQGDGVITRGTATSDKVEFDVSIGAGAGAVVLKFSGKLENDQLGGTVKSPFGPAAKFTANRRTPPVVAPNAIELQAVETDESQNPISALSSTAVPAKPSSPLPVEFPEDRRSRSLRTNGNVLIRNGTIITGTGTTLLQHSLLIKNGLIAAIGPDLQPEPDMTVIDAAGRYLMPGMIDTHSHIMISNGLDGVNEATHSIVCEVRVNDVITTSDPQEYRALAGGATTLRLFHGSANVIGGQDAVVQLKHGTTAAEHLFPGSRAGVKFALGENVKFRRGRFPNTRLGVEATLQRAFIEALEYRREWQEFRTAEKAAKEAGQTLLPPRRDLRLEALAEILSQEKFIHSHCYRSDEILMLLRVAQSHGIRVWSLQHVLEGYKVAPEIVAHGASCSTFADWWAYKVEAYDATPCNAALLHEAGANVVIKSDNDELMRHLNQEAAKTVRYGSLPPEAALSLVTLNAARELGIEDKLGSLEVGKQGDVAIFNAHPLNTFARCELTIIAGEPQFIRDKQPTAMTAAGLAASQTPREISIPPRDQRQPVLDWSSVTGSRFALVGGTIHPVDGPDIIGGTVLCEGGRIAAITAGEQIPEGCPSVNVQGLHLYPGLIDSGTTVGLTEIGKVVETHDFAEVGQFQPDLQAGVAINPDSELIPVARAGGITTALIRPTGGVIAGQASIMQLTGWTAPEMVRVPAAGLQIQWPGVHDNADAFEQLRKWFKEARIYDAARLAAPAAGGLARLVDPRYEALRPYVRGERPIFIEAHSQQHLTETLKFAAVEKVKVILCGATDAWKVAEELRKADVPVIVGPVMRAPLSAHDPFDATYANPGQLHEAGVRFCIRSDNAANSRNAPIEAGIAVAYGLPEEAALRSVTLSAAEILGIAADCGSLTVGKRADLVILDGSPLQVTSQIKGVIIAGQPYRPESRQTRLYEKYRERLQQQRTK